MQTLKLEANVTQKTEIEIPVPFFARRDDEREYIALLDSDTVVIIYKSDAMATIRNTQLHLSKDDLLRAFNSWHSCTETEFLDKYDAVIESISLHPKIAV